MNKWKFTDDTKTVVYRVNEDGSIESCFVEAIAEWLAEGNVPESGFCIFAGVVSTGYALAAFGAGNVPGH